MPPSLLFPPLPPPPPNKPLPQKTPLSPPPPFADVGISCCKLLATRNQNLKMKCSILITLCLVNPHFVCNSDVNPENNVLHSTNWNPNSLGPKLFAFVENGVIVQTLPVLIQSVQTWH